DTSKPNVISTDTMFLEFSRERSVYYNPSKRISDSLLYTQIQKSMQTGAMFHLNKAGDIKKNSTVIVHQYPNAGKLTYFSKNIGLRPFTYEETYPLMQWQLSEETKIIQGYECKKATTTFRGRSYEVWYAPAIPTNFGPYKFYGLPGLIVFLQDSRKHFTFELIGLQKLPKNYQMITHYDIGEPILFEKITLKRYNEEMRKYAEDPIAYLSATLMKSPVQVEVKNSQGKNIKKKLIYNPIELNEE
ncbi:MAG: GLPGLI family protein, partial [Raineya sp.]